MRILVCGGRNYGRVERTKPNPADEPDDTQERLKEYKHVHEVLSRLVCDYSEHHSDNDNWLPTDIVIIAGGAKGADSAAADFAAVAFCQLQEFKADWNKHGKAAGAIRNQQMLDEGKPDLVVAFPGGRGTADMVSRAKKAGIEVREIG